MLIHAFVTQQHTPKQIIMKNRKSDNHYAGTCRKLTIDDVRKKILNGQPYAVRIKSDIQQFTINHFQDQVYGTVTATKFDDFIIVKSDKWPTFHLANVIDDWKMEISHVIRGQQWLTNTSKHIYLYKMLEAVPPKFAHLPLLLSANGKKLSKRDPTCSFQPISQRYLGSSILNFVGLLGWNPPQSVSKQQIISLQDMIKLFNLSQISRNPVRIDIKKLNFLNKFYIKKVLKSGTQHEKQFLLQRLYHFNPISKHFTKSYNFSVINAINFRIAKFDQFKHYRYFYQGPDYKNKGSLQDFNSLFGKQAKLTISNKTQQKEQQISSPKGELSCPKSIDIQIFIQNLDPQIKIHYIKLFHNLRLIFEHLVESFDEKTIAMRISELIVENTEFKNEQVYHVLRYVLTGLQSGPNAAVICQILGKAYVCSLLENFMKALSKST